MDDKRTSARQWARAACERYSSDDVDVEIYTPVFTRAAYGAWVKAWLYVPDEEYDAVAL